MSKQEFENKYRIFKEVEAFCELLAKKPDDEQISEQLETLSDSALKKVLEIMAASRARRRNG